MPSALRAQVALIGLLAVLLIPISTSSLRGLTHILTCRDQASTPFSIDVPEAGQPVISSSNVIERRPDGSVNRSEVCGGLTLDMQIGNRGADRADVTLAVTNPTDYGWRGSVQLQLGDTDIPIDIGPIDAGATAVEDFELRLDAGRSYVLEGNLLIGP